MKTVLRLTGVAGLLFATLAVSSAGDAAASSAFGCPAALGDGAGLAAFSVFDIVDGERYELAPEDDGARLAWTAGGDGVDVAAAVCAYADGTSLTLEAPAGARMRCEASWNTAAGTYEDIPSCAVLTTGG